MRPLVTALLLALPLAACDPSQPSHLGNPLLLPISGAGTAIENGFYNARRARVSAFVNAHYDDLVQEIRNNETTLAYAGMDIARVPLPSRPVLFDELRTHPEIYLTGAREKMVVAFMVYGR